MVDYPHAGTIFDVLSRNHISWANYHDVSSFGIHAKRLLGTAPLVFARRLMALIGKVIPTVLHRAIGNLQFTADLYPLGFASAHGHLKSLRQFFRDVTTARCPHFPSSIPASASSPRRTRKMFQFGEAFAAEVITRVMTGKNWSNTVLIWVYDEPGGYSTTWHRRRPCALTGSTAAVCCGCPAGSEHSSSHCFASSSSSSNRSTAARTSAMTGTASGSLR